MKDQFNRELFKRVYTTCFYNLIILLHPAHYVYMHLIQLMNENRFTNTSALLLIPHRLNYSSLYLFHWQFKLQTIHSNEKMAYCTQCDYELMYRRADILVHFYDSDKPVIVPTRERTHTQCTLGIVLDSIYSMWVEQSKHNLRQQMWNCIIRTAPSRMQIYLSDLHMEYSKNTVCNFQCKLKVIYGIMNAIHSRWIILAHLKTNLNLNEYKSTWFCGQISNLPEFWKFVKILIELPKSPGLMLGHRHLLGST